MLWIGDLVVLLMSIAALVYGVKRLLSKKIALYFQLIIGAVGCHILGYCFDLCELLTKSSVTDGFNIGYLGNVGCFLFLITANFGCMDGIIDDGSSGIKKFRFIALIAPLFVALLYIPNLFLDVTSARLIIYAAIWIAAMFCAYLNLKHVIIPDMGFGFVRAIRPFNISVLCFIALKLVYLTLRCYSDWILLVIAGVLLGASVISMIVMAERGVKKWTI